MTETTKAIHEAGTISQEAWDNLKPQTTPEERRLSKYEQWCADRGILDWESATIIGLVLGLIVSFFVVPAAAYWWGRFHG